MQSIVAGSRLERAGQDRHERPSPYSVGITAIGLTEIDGVSMHFDGSRSGTRVTFINGPVQRRLRAAPYASRLRTY